MQTANLVQVTNELFTYNADGLRVATSGTAETKKIVWDGQAYLLETDSSNVTQVVYTQGVGPFGDLVSQRRSGATTYYLFDALGSTDRLLSSAQAVLNSYVYKAFGEIAASTGSTANPFRFVGRYGYYYYGWSLGSDLYVRARWYKPVQARWLSLDPLGFAAGDYNLFRYVWNGPINDVDPNGLGLWDPSCRVYTWLWPVSRKGIPVPTPCNFGSLLGCLACCEVAGLTAAEAAVCTLLCNRNGYGGVPYPCKDFASGANAMCKGMPPVQRKQCTEVALTICNAACAPIYCLSIV